MNFMHEIAPAADRIARLADGSVDIRRMEMLARQQQREALGNAVRLIPAAIARAISGARSTRQNQGFREA
jgi:hypothetical protein